jgi:hypothetical protein
MISLALSSGGLVGERGATRAEAPQPSRESDAGPSCSHASNIPLRSLALRLGPQFLVSLLMKRVHQGSSWLASFVQPLLFRSSGGIKAEMRPERQWTTRTEWCTKWWTIGDGATMHDAVYWDGAPQRAHRAVSHE